MSLKIEETFQVRAPVERVWRYLVDPRQVVGCLPGAELTEEQENRTYLGRVKVKVGPVTAAYSGKATIVEQDDSAHVVRLAAEGRETGGSGSAKMTMTSRMTAVADDTTEVHVLADVDVVGKVVQFGRGMIESVSKQLFKQFTDCVRAQLETAQASAVAATLSGGDAGGDGAPAPPAAAVPVGAAAPVATGVNAAPAVAFAAQAPLPVGASGGASGVTASGEPLKVLPLLLRALWDVIARLWRRPKRG
jgi:carbon monoxide dehydrogenase subunit G